MSKKQRERVEDEANFHKQRLNDLTTTSASMSGSTNEDVRDDIRDDIRDDAALSLSTSNNNNNSINSSVGGSDNNRHLNRFLIYCKTRNVHVPLILAFRAMKLFWRP